MNVEKKDFFDIVSNNLLVKTILSIALGFVAGAVFLAILKVDFIDAYSKLFFNIFKSPEAFTYCIVFATPYILTGLSVVFANTAGIFNIGAEGQFVIGEITALTVALTFNNLPFFILIPICIVVAMVAGAIWGIIVSFLKLKFSLNEIITMIMFNWIAFYLSNFVVETYFRNEGGGAVSRTIPDTASLCFSKGIINTLGVCKVFNIGIVFAIVIALLINFIIKKTTFGFAVKVVGKNINAAKAMGIDVKKVTYHTFAISGAIAALGGAIQLLGMSKRISVFYVQEGYGFGGIVVALTSMFNPIASIFSGFFYGAFKYTGKGLNLIGIPTEVVNVIMGTIVFFIAISSIFEYIKYLKINLQKSDKGVNNK